MSESIPSRKLLPLWLALAALIALLVVAGVVIYRQSRISSDQAARIAANAAETEKLRRELHQAQANPSVAPAPQAAPVQPPPVKDLSPSKEELAAAEQHAEQLRASLAQANSDVAHLQTQLLELRARVESASAENRRLADSVEDGKAKLAESNHAMESLRADLKANTERVLQLEAANAAAKQDASAAKQSTAQLNETISELQSIYHRRDMYLTDVQSRYREVTEQYRSLAGVMDARRDRQSTPVPPPELSRIQNAISLADEDLKQIRGLDAQVLRLQKKLAGK